MFKPKGNVDASNQANGKQFYNNADHPDANSTNKESENESES